VAVCFPTRDVGIIYFLNNVISARPVSSTGWRVVIKGPKGREFDSRFAHLFLNMIKIIFN
jgi:hypothetical protein